MVDTAGLNLRMTKKYNQYTTEKTKCPEDDATREKKGGDKKEKYRTCGELQVR